MSNSDRMQKLDLSKLKDSDLSFIKLIEQQNRDRVLALKKLRRRNLFTVGLLGAGILGIYGYSMYAVKQENFLDDFEEPETTNKQ